MCFARFVFGPMVAILMAVAAPSHAGNVLYNFNANDGEWTVVSGTTPTAQPWEWTGGASVNEGGWHSRRGNDPAGSGTYLVSPCFVVDDVDGEYVRMDIRHRFDFGTAENPTGLGQVQYQINNGDWLGIRTADFLATSGKIPPSYLPTGSPFIVTTSIPSAGAPHDVDAWVGKTVKFDVGDHQDSQFTLDFSIPPSPTSYPIAPGDEIRFRFLMGPLVDLDPAQINWEINRVQIDGVLLCPEPGGIALALAGGGVLLLGMTRRRLRWLTSLQRSAAGGVVTAVAIVAWVAFGMTAAKADQLFDFQLTSGSWTKSHEGFVPSSFRWTYFSSGSTSDPRWSVKAMGVDGINAATANHLTSPSISGTTGEGPAVNARISIAHNFLLPPSGTGGPLPISLGQLSYRLNNSGPWIGLPLEAFSSGTNLNNDDPVFGPSPFKNQLNPSDPFYVDQLAFVAPTYLTPSGTSTSALPYVSPDGAAFVGQSNGWLSSLYVPSQALLNFDTGLPLSGITSLELRLTNANLGGNCNNNEGWNVRMVQVDFSSQQPPVPEPGTLALAMIGVGGVLAARARRRWKRSLPGSPPAFQAQ